MDYTEEFLSALGQWQTGWREDRARRLPIAEQLQRAVAALPAPLPLTNPLPLCYRKRFLVPNNNQNGGDFVPLVRDGRIEEGLASWTTEFAFAQSFKKDLRVGEIMTIFKCQPTPEVITVDIPALWKDPSFSSAVQRYVAKGGPNAGALQNFQSTQFELILSSPLLSSSIVAFGGPTSSPEKTAQSAGITDPAAIDAVRDAMNNARIYQGDVRWVVGERALQAFNRTVDEFQDRIVSLSS